MSRVALIDGLLPEGFPGLAARIDLAGGAAAESPAGRHAAAMAAALRAGAPEAEILNLAIFPGRMATSLATLVAALDRARAEGAGLVLCALGLARPDPTLDAAIVALHEAGACVVAAAAARGGPVWPAACEGVLSVQGDARCGPGAWSRLDLPTAEWGACPRAASDPEIMGASVAAAHLAGIAAALPEGDPRAALRDGAAFHGREHRR